MKRFTATFLMSAMLTIMLSATGTLAQTRSCNSNNGPYTNERGQYQNSNDQYYDNNQYYDSNTYQSNSRPNVYQRHRKAINIAIATGSGAIIGALLGGRRGAFIGAAAGVAGGAIATKKQRPRNYYRY